MAAGLNARLRRLEGLGEGDAAAPLGVLVLPAGVEVGTPEADRLIENYRSRTRCAAAVVLSASDAAL